jgi:hypothetical protein
MAPTNILTANQDSTQLNDCTDLAASSAADDRLSPKVMSKDQVTLLGNGMLGLENTPKHLESIVQRNIVQSSFLRLPGEVRNKIWEYTLGGHTIEFCEYKIPRITKRGSNRLPRKRVVSVFDVPQICRQIYYETANMAFSLNKLVFTNENISPFAMKRWAAKVHLKAGQLNAVHTVQLRCNSPNSYYYFDVWKDNGTITSLFPSLRRIVINRLPPRSIHNFNPDTVDDWDLLPPWGWEARINEKIDKMRGDSIEIIFED